MWRSEDSLWEEGFTFRDETHVSRHGSKCVCPSRDGGEEIQTNQDPGLVMLHVRVRIRGVSGVCTCVHVCALMHVFKCVHVEAKVLPYSCSALLS